MPRDDLDAAELAFATHLGMLDAPVKEIRRERLRRSLAPPYDLLEHQKVADWEGPQGMCVCGRRRCNIDDLIRWRNEFPSGEPATDPPWAAVICWSSAPLDHCNRKKLEPASP